MPKPKYYYHGSSHDLTVLKPKSSRVIEGEDAVFATDSSDLAVIFIPKWNDCDLDLGYHHNILYVMEQYPGAFEKLKNVSGFLYSVDPEQFGTDHRLGMQKHEFISKQPVKIVKTEKISSVYKFLKDSSMNMITYDQKLDAVFGSGLITITDCSDSDTETVLDSD